MTPQTSFMVVAKVARVNIASTRRLLATMNSAPGVADPANGLVPFGEFDNLHFARFVVLDDQTIADLTTLYGIERPEPPVYLAFLGDIDGDYDAFMDELVSRAAPGLRRIFSCCEDFTPSGNLKAWLAAHEYRPAAYYFNWVGRTVRQTREEERLRLALRDYLYQTPGLPERAPGEIHRALRAFRAGRPELQLSPAGATPTSFAIRHVLDWCLLIGLLIGGIVTIPITLIPALILLAIIRRKEETDPEYSPRPDPAWAAGLAVQEDFDVTNQFSVMGSLKPGWLHAALLFMVMKVVDLTARTIYTKGRLGRVYTIHAARWVYLDGGSRMYFASNYDGSLDAYMDDFINKVAFGLNVVFTNGIGYPRTRFLVLGGAKDEQHYKYHLRRHQLPTDVWYNAHAGSTAFDLHRNSVIREGLEAASLGDRECREWVALL
jgi:hypothetical protein